MNTKTSYDASLRRVFPNCVIEKQGKPLQLPYQSRNPNAITSIIFESIYKLKCGDKNISIIVFVAKGLKDKLFICSGAGLSIEFKDITISDVLSGLNLRLRQPILCIDDCCMEFNWKKSRFVLPIERISRCAKCKQL